MPHVASGMQHSGIAGGLACGLPGVWPMDIFRLLEHAGLIAVGQTAAFDAVVIRSQIAAVLKRTRAFFRGSPDRFLPRVTGVIHVGANAGQERHLYHSHRLKVVWVEPIPEVFAQLEANIAAFPRQRAIQGLVSDVDGKSYDFHVSTNQGLSSSFLALKHHRDIWPDVRYEKDLVLTSLTLPTLLARHGIDHHDYQALVLDTQGSELLVLQGAGSLLPAFTHIKTEAPDFEAYEGCCRISEISALLAGHGFREQSRSCFARRRQGGRYYDVVYARD